MHDTNTLILACIGSFVAGFVVCLAFKMLFVTPWLRAFFSGGQVSLMSILGMRLRGSPVNMLLDAHLSMIQSGEPSRIRIVESTYIANKTRIHTTDDLVELVREVLRRESEARGKKRPLGEKG